MLGIVAADLYVREYRIARLAYLILPVALFAAFLSTAASDWTYTERGPYWGIAMFVFVVAAGTTPAVRAVLSWRPLTLIGFASYGIYLIHEPVIGLIRDHIGMSAEGYGPFAVTCAGAVIAGLAFSFVAERPFVSSGLKHVLVANVEHVLFRWLAACKVGTALVLTSSEVPDKVSNAPADSIVIADSIETPIAAVKAGAQS